MPKALVGESATEAVELPVGATVVPAKAMRAALGLVPDCATAEGCPAAGRGHWLRHVDKDGQRSTVTEPDGNVWNRACPVAGCTRRVFG